MEVKEIATFLCALAYPRRESYRINSPNASGLSKDAPVPLEAVITTAELNQRPSHAADHAAVNSRTGYPDAGNGPLAKDHPAAISRYGPRPVPGSFRGYQPARGRGRPENLPLACACGTVRPHLWGTTPREFSPCGTVLDRNTPQLMSYLERHYTYFEQVSPQIVEALLIPFHAGGQAVGTVCVISHDASRRFDAEDLV